MNDTNFPAFPKTAAEAIALMYVEKNVEPNTAASEMYRMYYFAYKEILEEMKSLRHELQGGR